MAKQAVKKVAAKKEVAKRVSTGGEPLPKKEKAPVKEDIFKGMTPIEKRKVIEEMAMDAFKNSTKVLIEIKKQLNLFDERHPVMAAIKQNETVLAYINEENENEG